MAEEQTSLEQLLADYELGEEAKRFVESQLGKVILGRARQQMEEAMEELKTVWPWRTNRIRHLQGVIARSGEFNAWLADLIVNAQMAQELLNDSSGE